MRRISRKEYYIYREWAGREGATVVYGVGRESPVFIGVPER
jgi:hypothetical protein